MINVLITGTGGGGIGEQILKALKMSSLELTLFGTDSTAVSKNKHEFNKFFKVPIATNKNYCEELLNICTRFKIDVIFPGSEPELKVISVNRKLFEKEEVFLPINPNNVIDICLDKVKTVEFLKSNGYSYPRSIYVKSEDDLEKVDFSPAVIKPSIGGSGSANTMIVQSKEEIHFFGKYMLTMYEEFIIQEYIGVPEHEYTVGVLVSMDGKYINSIALKRIITSGLGCKLKVKNRSENKMVGETLIISSGISQGEIGKFPMITKICSNLALSLGARSSINIQCRYFQNEVYVFEINPRYSGTTSLRAMAGYNEPEELLKIHFNKETPIIDKEFSSCVILRGLNETKI